MPQTWGQRYFEEQPSDTPENTHNSNNTNNTNNNNNPRFHEVYGKRKFRKFHQPASNRGTPNSRRRPRNSTSTPSHSVSAPPHHPHRSPHARRATAHVDTDARTPDIFPTGNKRPSFDRAHFDGKRKKRYVPGGLIPKFRRIEEYGGGTFCDVCNESFRDVNAKALHDRSYKHRRNYGYLRNENKNKTQHPVEHTITPIQQSQDEQRKDFEEGMNAFMDRDIRKLPKDFQEWINTSLADARKAAVEAKDPSLVQAVQREIVDVFRVNEASCTLRRVCWTRRELATGKAYRLAQPAPETLPVIQDAKIHIKVAATATKVEEKPKADKPIPATTPRLPPMDIVEEIVDEDQNASPRVTDPPTIHVHTKSAPVQEEHLQYCEIPLLWRRSRAAETLLSCCETHDREAVLANYYSVFGAGKGQGSDHEQEDSESAQSSIATYRALLGQYQSEQFVYDDIMTSLSTVAKQLEQSGKHIEILRNIFRMQIEIALQCGEFCDCFEPCSKFVGTYARRGYVRGTSATFVGHWLVSLFFKDSPGTSRKRFPPLLEVAQEMRKFPIGALDDIWVYEAIQAIKATLGNNWCSFFGRSMSSIVHTPKSTSKQILEGLVPFMRERALITMTHMNVSHMQGVGRSFLQNIPGSDARGLLGWNLNDNTEESCAEMEEFVSSLPQHFEVVQEEDNSDSIRWKGKPNDNLSLSCESDAKEDMLAKWSRSVVLDEN